MQLEAENGKPSAPKLILDGIPDELKQQVRWVGWRYSDKAGKWTKVPIACTSGRPADVTKSKDWTSFEQTRSALAGKRLDGLGFVFSEDDPYVGIDLDSSRDPKTGLLHPWSEQIVHALDSYAEVSPSGTGVHVIVKGQKPPDSRSRQGNIEVYSNGRYFTMTGNRLGETPKTVEARQAALGEVLRRLARTDDDIIRLATEAANGDKFSRLWGGDWSGYKSESEADLALCGMLAFWTGGDAARMEAMFGQSGLGRREKWLKRPDYRTATVKQAITGQSGAMLTRVTRINQITRNKQEKPGSKHNTTPEVVVSPPVEDRQGKAVELALKLATEVGDAPIWETSFRLARRLRTLSDDQPAQYEAAVRAFCEKTGQDYEEFWYGFILSWDKVKMAEGDDVLTWAANMAEAEPYPLSSCLGPTHGRIASIAWHLSHHTAPGPFFLPVLRLRDLLGLKNAMTVSRVNELLEKDGIIKCINEDYSYRGKDRKAKEFRFTGPQPD